MRLFDFGGFLFLVRNGWAGEKGNFYCNRGPPRLESFLSPNFGWESDLRRTPEGPGKEGRGESGLQRKEGGTHPTGGHGLCLKSAKGDLRERSFGIKAPFRR